MLLDAGLCPFRHYFVCDASAKATFTTWISVYADAMRVERLQVEISRHTQLHRFHPIICQINREDPCWHI